jgi:hypothetical protein
VASDHVIGDDAGDQVIAAPLGAPEQIAVADMKKVKGPRSIADADHGEFPSIVDCPEGNLATRQPLSAPVLAMKSKLLDVD